MRKLNPQKTGKTRGGRTAGRSGSNISFTVSILAAVFSAVLVTLAVRNFILDAAVVEGQSMLPTLKPGSVALVLRCAYGLTSPGGGYLVRWSTPRAGDVVATINPETGRAVVKRVVTVLPGFPADEPSLFLMGDNPAESLDSRKYGLLPVESVLGRVILLKPWVNP